MGNKKVQVKGRNQSQISSLKLIEMFREESRTESNIDIYCLPTKYNFWSTSEDNSFLTLTDKDYSIF